jgi:hypothetical protein
MDAFTYTPADPIFEARLTGWLDGYHLYTAMVARSPKPYVDRPSYSSLERIRGNEANGDRIDADNARRFAEASR